MLNRLLGRVRSRKGVAMIEYALLAALIALAVLGIVRTLGVNLTNIFTDISNALAGARPAGP